jgi:hypothetical protein
MAAEKLTSSTNTRSVPAPITQTRGLRQAGYVVENASSICTGQASTGSMRARPNSPVRAGGRVNSPRSDSRAGSPSPAARRPVSPRREVTATVGSPRVSCVVLGTKAIGIGPSAVVDSPKPGHRALPVQAFGTHSMPCRSPRTSQTNRFAGPSGAVPTLKSPRPPPLATNFASSPGLPTCFEASASFSARRSTLKSAGSGNRAASADNKLVEPPMSRDRRHGERGQCSVMRQLSAGQRRCDMLRTSVR